MPAEHPALAESRQLLLVLAPQWESGSANLYQYERAQPGEPWQLLQVIPVSLGKTGLAWGTGLHGSIPGPGPQKREGDGKSPAGIFALGPAFGYEARTAAAPGALPFVQITEQTYGVEDPHSQYYNTITDATKVQPDWQGGDHMLRQDDLYRYGVMVQHNPAPGPQEPALGSCIFLHVWRGPGQTTAGCTAMELGKMAEVRDWLRAEAQPRLVQLTTADYHRLRDTWGLPKTPEPPPLTFTLLGIGAMIMAAAAWFWSRRRQASLREKAKA